MMYDDVIWGKSAVFHWKQYKEYCLNAFVLDEENQIHLLEDAFCRIGKIDSGYKLYVSTYPIERKEDGISAYANMVWIKTKMSCEELERFFSDYREIEPSEIFGLTDEEKSTVDIYVNEDLQYCDYEQVSDLFLNSEIKILYWD